LGHSGDEGLIAPSVLIGEVACVLLKCGRGLRWGAARVAEMAEVIDLFQVRLIEIAQPVATMVRFATRHNVSGFDAFSLALAMSAGVELATLDKGLRAAARNAGVELA
jgi:predicted nucleic acid-binding protein